MQAPDFRACLTLERLPRPAAEEGGAEERRSPAGRGSRREPDAGARLRNA
eukprot:SAG31_NODE_1249_length_9118_cov_23.165318_8_plen_50_part_00